MHSHPKCLTFPFRAVCDCNPKRCCALSRLFPARSCHQLYVAGLKIKHRAVLCFFSSGAYKIHRVGALRKYISMSSCPGGVQGTPCEKKMFQERARRRAQGKYYSKIGVLLTTSSHGKSEESAKVTPPPPSPPSTPHLNLYKTKNPSGCLLTILHLHPRLWATKHTLFSTNHFKLIVGSFFHTTIAVNCRSSTLRAVLS